jgi:catechol 2,3-dioxygenase-like lactoylglutathione lyase family enzyme
MAKIRHIAYRATDVDAMAKFFVDAMGMKLIQKRKNNAIDLSDGSVNITVLPLAAGMGGKAGIDHIGFSVENDQEQFARMEAAGATKAGAVNLSSRDPRASSSTWATGRVLRRSIKNRHCSFP